MRRSLAGIAAAAAAAVVCIGDAPAAQQTAPAERNPAASRDAKLNRIAEIIAGSMDKAHGGPVWRTHAAYACDVTLALGDVALAGRIAVQVNGRAARLDLKDGAALIFDGQDTWITPASSSLQVRPAACLQAWRELLVLPFVAQNAGVRLTEYRSMYAVGRDTDAFIVTDKAANGRPVRATARVYADVRSHQLVAFGCSDLAERLGLTGEAPPRAVVFSDMTIHEGVTLPMTWLLYDWTEAAGVRGDALGSITLSKPQFLRSDEVQFDRPADARQIGEAKPTTQPVPRAKP